MDSFTPVELEQFKQQYGSQINPSNNDGSSTDHAARMQRLNALVNGTTGQETPSPETSQSQPEQKQSFLGKASQLAENTFGKAADFAFGSTGKVAGSMVGGLGQNVEALTRPSSLKQTTDPALQQQLQNRGLSSEEIQQKTSQPTEDTFDVHRDVGAGTMAMSALELYPGGGEASKLLSKLPGGSQLVEGLGKILNFIPEKLKANAIKEYSQMLNPTTQEMKTLTQKIVPEALNRNVVGRTLEGIASKAEEKAGQFGAEIGKYWENLPEGVRTEAQPIIKKLDDLKNKYIVNGVTIKPEAIAPIESLQQKIGALAKDGFIETKNMRQLRQILDTSVDMSKGFTKDALANFTKNTEKVASNAIRSELAKDSPDLAKLNKDYTFWTNLQDVAQATADRKTGQTGGLGKWLGRGIGGILGAESGQNYTQKAEFGILGMALGSKAIEFMGSPAWKSVAAVSKNKIADYLASGAIKNASLLMSKLIPVTKNVIEKD